MTSLLAASAKSIAPPVRWKPSEWAEKRMFLSPEASAEPGRITFERACYQREMMDAIADPAIEDVVIMSSAQVGKTSVVLAIIGYLIDLQPCPILSINPTLEMAEAFSKDRLAPLFRDSPTFANKIRSPQSRQSGNTLLSKKFPGGILTLAGANSPASLASRPIRAVIGDELDRWPESAGTEGDPVNLAKKRTTTFWNKIHVWVSTPTIKDRSRIEKIWLLSDRREYEVQCPHCGEYQVLTWDNLKYKDKGSVDLKKDDIEDIRYECPHCSQAIEETQKSFLLKTGRWAAKGKRGKIAGFHINELYSPWKLWEDIARDYESAIGDPLRLQVFWNTSLGLPYEHDLQTKFDWETLEMRGQDANYQMGTIPDGVLLLTAGVDVQGDRLECSVFGWGEGEQSWLIRHDQLYGDPLDDNVWDDLDSLLSQEYPHPLGGTIKIRKTAIDSGYLAQEVYRRSRGRRDWMVVKGVAGDRRLVGAGQWQEINIRNKPIKRGIKTHALGVDLLKQTLLGRCRINAPGPKYINIPNNAPSKYCQGLAGSEVMVRKKIGGTWKYAWEPVPGVRNEPLDCAVYAYSAALFLGLARFTDNHWQKLRQPLEQPTAGQETPAPPVEPPKPRRPTQKPRRHNNYLGQIGQTLRRR